MKRDLAEYGADVHGVRQMIIYGLKGMSTYAKHARHLGEWTIASGNSRTRFVFNWIVDSSNERPPKKIYDKERFEIYC